MNYPISYSRVLTSETGGCGRVGGGRFNEIFFIFCATDSDTTLAGASAFGRETERTLNEDGNCLPVCGGWSASSLLSCVYLSGRVMCLSFNNVSVFSLAVPPQGKHALLLSAFSYLCVGARASIHFVGYLHQRNISIRRRRATITSYHR